MRGLLIIVIMIFGLTTAYAYAGMGHGMMMQADDHVGDVAEQERVPDTYSSNGERIYYTGMSGRSGRIPFTGGPMWLEMHGGNCVNCHGTSGQGGFPIMMEDIIPPDIRYETLTVEEHLHHGKKEIHQRYTDDLIKRATIEGINPDGKALSIIMPRYSMKEEDLDDLINYLKTLK